jgi:hypothetical protein
MGTDGCERHVRPSETFRAHGARRAARRVQEPARPQMFPVKHLILHVVPFPKNAPTAPELLVIQDDGAWRRFGQNSWP